MFIFNFSIGASLIFCAFFYGLNYSNLLLILPLEESPILQLASFWFFFTFVICTAKLSLQNSIQNFILNQKMLEEKEKSILAQKNLSEQTKGFLPSVIYKRILNMHNNEGSSVVEATDEVLRAKKKNIVCLFSDIRNYTNSTKNIDNFLDRSAIPNIKLITSITDKNNGISRLIGDLF